MLAKIRKAIVAAIAAGVASYSGDTPDDTKEWVYLIAMALAAGVVTYLIPNKKTKTDEIEVTDNGRSGV